MKPTILAVCVLFASAWAWAENPAEVELLSAQKAYQEALKSQTDSQGRSAALQTRLTQAEHRLVQTQAEVSRLQGEVAQADAARAQADTALQAAGARLDAAWRAVHGGQ